MHSNLGGLGPDTGSPSEMRFANVVRVTVAGDSLGDDGRRLAETSVVFDLVVVNMSMYTPADSSRNVRTGHFAQINFKPNTQADLRVYVRPSCAKYSECKRCDDPIVYPSTRARATCYAAGCSCYAESCFTPACCTPARRAQNARSYQCPQMNLPVSLPQGSLVGLSLFDLDTGASGEYGEQVTIDKYDYFVTPLRAASGREDLVSTVHVNKATRTFSGTARGTGVGQPTDPNALTDEQAARAVQIFFTSDDGYLDATFRISHDPSIVPGVPADPLGRDILFAGSTSLCAPPPPRTSRRPRTTCEKSWPSRRKKRRSRRSCRRWRSRRRWRR